MSVVSSQCEVKTNPHAYDHKFRNHGITNGRRSFYCYTMNCCKHIIFRIFWVRFNFLVEITIESAHKGDKSPRFLGLINPFCIKKWPLVKMKALANDNNFIEDKISVASLIPFMLRIPPLDGGYFRIVLGSCKSSRTLSKTSRTLIYYFV